MGLVTVSPNPKRHKIFIDPGSGQIIENPYPNRLRAEVVDEVVERIATTINDEGAEVARSIQSQKELAEQANKLAVVVDADSEIAALEAKIEALREAKAATQARKAARLEELKREIAEIEEMAK